MKVYHDLVQRVLDHGVRKTNRTGTDTISNFAEYYKVDLSGGFPLLTTKKVFFKSVILELLWYLRVKTISDGFVTKIMFIFGMLGPMKMDMLARFILCYGVVFLFWWNTRMKMERPNGGRKNLIRYRMQFKCSKQTQ